MNPPAETGALGPLHETILRWYAAHGRDLPWRRPDRTPWGVFVSEIMLQQTQVSRVEPVWRAWLERWPTPAALAAEPVGEAIRAWGRLGYPRRAVRLHAAATAMVDRHDGGVPDTEAELAGLPGVGGYTAAAVAAFAYGRRSTVVDTNVRRVLARLLTGAAQAAPTLTTAERRLAAAALPLHPADAATWNVAVMEIGALICTARAPACESCPVADRCAWLRAGRPAYDGPIRRAQRWEGTDRQLRGAILQALRDAPGPLTRRRLLTSTCQQLVTQPEASRYDRCLDSLVADGLVEPLPRDRLALPGVPPPTPRPESRDWSDSTSEPVPAHRQDQ